MKLIREIFLVHMCQSIIIQYNFIMSNYLFGEEEVSICYKLDGVI